MFQVSHLVIVGGGFSGTLLAINLLRYGTMRVTLVERRPERLGKGVAFGSALRDVREERGKTGFESGEPSASCKYSHR